MFRENRKKGSGLTEQECLTVLGEQNTAVLGLIGDNGYPYGVPLNYIYKNGRIFSYGAKEGHKIDSIKKNPKACLSIIAKNEPVPGKLSTNYESVILFGQVKILVDKADRYDAFMALLEHVRGSYEEEGVNYLEEKAETVAPIEFIIEHISGKANQEVA